MGMKDADGERFSSLGASLGASRSFDCCSDSLPGSVRRSSAIPSWLARQLPRAASDPEMRAREIKKFASPMRLSCLVNGTVDPSILTEKPGPPEWNPGLEVQPCSNPSP